MAERKDCLEKDGVWDQAKNICHVDMDGPDVINDNTSYGTSGESETHGVAVIAGIIFPGGGQIVNGRYLKALVILLTAWLVVPWIYGIIEASKGR